MRLALTLIIILISSGISTTAQTNTFPSNGNVGIGTINPQSKIEIAGPINLRYNSTAEYWLKHTDINNSIISGFKREANGLLIRAFEGIKFSVGNTETPVLEVHANGDIKATGSLHVSTGNATGAGIAFADDGDIVDLNDGWATHRFIHGLRITNSQFGGSPVVQLANGISGYTYFNAGNVGIGTTNPTEKLSVNGKIRAKEVKVEAANWPDYVFAKDYPLLELKELEGYIKVNKHLPEIPSAKELESNGVELGEMNKLLLKKIEELTLYLIESKKESDQFKQALLDSDAKYKILEGKILNLELNSKK